MGDASHISRPNSPTHQHYDDILSKIPEAPQWFDEHAVPRYCEFAPDRCADIHCAEAVLIRITCQYAAKHSKLR
jgi:hypothetical protein